MLCIEDKAMLSQTRAKMLNDELYGGEICEVKRRTYTFKFGGGGRMVRKDLSGGEVSKF